MTLSPFTVYLVLQLDSIRTGVTSALGVAAAMCIAIRFVAFIRYDTASGAAVKDAKESFQKSPQLTTGIILSVCAFLSWATIPSTGTAAAMFIAPAIVNSAVVQRDIPELYTLGIERLKGALSTANTVEPVK